MIRTWFIAVFAGDVAVTGKLARAAEVFVPIVVVGELLFEVDLEWDALK